MDIHRYEKLWFGLALLLIVAFIGTITYAAVGAGVQMVGDDGGTVDPDAVSDHEKFQQYQNSQATKVDEGEYAVAIHALQFAFIPGTGQPVEVPANSEVTFYVTTSDVIHGMDVVGSNVNVMVIPGQMAEFTVEFDDYDERQSYGLVCNEFCGAGHETMEGQLDVIPEDEWEDDDDE